MDNRNLITALVIAALITLAATAAGCTTNTSPSPTPIPSSQTTNGNNTTFSSGTGFNVTYPTSLKADTTTDPTTQVKIYVYLNPNSKVDGVNVGTVALSAGQTLGQRHKIPELSGNFKQHHDSFWTASTNNRFSRARPSPA